MAQNWLVEEDKQQLGKNIVFSFLKQELIYRCKRQKSIFQIWIKMTNLYYLCVDNNFDYWILGI